MQKIQKYNKCKIINVGTGRSISINYLFKVMKEKLKSKSKFKKKRLDKFDPKKSSCNVKNLLIFLKLKKSFFTKLENGIEKTSNI
ncbi:MAG: hypothetical protein CMJ01_01765 [Pelagibacteraceae bacterium]|nr:hypothetical protein [Pelagibacteraceae bacterium]